MEGVLSMSQKQKKIAKQNKSKKLLLIIPLLLVGLAVSYFALIGFSIRPTATEEGGASLALYYADGTRLDCIGGDINITVYMCNYSSVPEDEVDAYVRDFSNYEELNNSAADLLFNDSLFLKEDCIYLARVMSFGIAQWIQLHSGLNEMVIPIRAIDTFMVAMFPVNLSDNNRTFGYILIAIEPDNANTHDYLPGIVQRPDDPFRDLRLTLIYTYTNNHSSPVIDYKYGDEMVIGTADYIQLNTNIYGGQMLELPCYYNATAKDQAETMLAPRLVYMDWDDPSYIIHVADMVSL